MRPPRPRIIISGTGRAGTTFLVQLLTELGLDTGYTPQTWPRDYDAHCAAGLEHDLADPSGPRIVKNPALCDTLPGLLASDAVSVEHAIIPIRELEAAARSRVRVGGAGQVPGGMWGTPDAAQQRTVLAEKFHHLLHTLAAHAIPVTLLAFPRFAQDADYTWTRLHPLLGDVDRAQFAAAFARVARPELIHDFTTGLPIDAGAPAQEYARRQQQDRQRRHRRRLRRVLIWTLVAGAAWGLTASARG